MISIEEGSIGGFAAHVMQFLALDGACAGMHARHWSWGGGACPPRIQACTSMRGPLQFGIGAHIAATVKGELACSIVQGQAGVGSWHRRQPHI